MYIKKRHIALMLAVVILTSVITAFATDNGLLSAFVAETKLLYEGKEVELKNKAVTIDDVTYVPLREFCEKTGRDVLWDGKEGKINVSEANKPEVRENFKRVYGIELPDCAVIVNSSYGEYMDDYLDDGEMINVYLAAKVVFPESALDEILALLDADEEIQPNRNLEDPNWWYTPEKQFDESLPEGAVRDDPLPFLKWDYNWFGLSYADAEYLYYGELTSGRLFYGEEYPRVLHIVCVLVGIMKEPDGQYALYCHKS